MYIIIMLVAILIVCLQRQLSKHEEGGFILVNLIFVPARPGHERPIFLSHKDGSIFLQSIYPYDSSGFFFIALVNAKD